MLRDRQSARRTSSPHPASHKFSPSSAPHMLQSLIHFPHFSGDEILCTEPRLNWKVMRARCQSAARDTGKLTGGPKIGPCTGAPSGLLQNSLLPGAYFQVCYSFASRYFYFHLSEGIVKSELPVTLQNPLFQGYYLNHWRYVGKTGHPIKP